MPVLYDLVTSAISSLVLGLVVQFEMEREKTFHSISNSSSHTSCNVSRARLHRSLLLDELLQLNKISGPPIGTQIYMRTLVIPTRQLYWVPSHLTAQQEKTCHGLNLFKTRVYLPQRFLILSVDYGFGGIKTSNSKNASLVHY